jgi:transcriptional regulator with XRE-family HTH domain
VRGGQQDGKAIEFGTLLRSLRQQAGLTQEELAGRARLAVRTIRYLERGQRRPLPSTVRLLSEALGVDGAALARFHATAREQRQARRSGGGSLRAATRRTPLGWAAAILAGAAHRLR